MLLDGRFILGDIIKIEWPGIWFKVEELSPLSYLFSYVSFLCCFVVEEQNLYILTLKAPHKNCSRHFNFLLLSFEENKA